MLELAYGAGLRVSEWITLAVRDVMLDDALVRVFGKGSKERLVPVGSYAREAVAAIRATLSTCLRDEDFAVAVPLVEHHLLGVHAPALDELVARGKSARPARESCDSLRDAQRPTACAAALRGSGV